MIKMRKIGLIGGTSWHSTIDYYRLINQLTNERKGKEANPEILMYSINIGLMFTQDWDLIGKEFTTYAKKLESIGAEGLALCANTPHKIAPQVSDAINIPLLHIADALGTYAQNQGIKTLGLLGTMPVMTGDFITGRIQEKFGIECLVPERTGVVNVHKMVVDELVKGVFSEEAKKLTIDEMNQLKEKGADGVILGCTELPILMKGISYDLPLLDSTAIHAKYCVDFVLND